MKGKTGMTGKFGRTDLVICSHPKERKTPFYSRINTVTSFRNFLITGSI